MIGGVVPHRRDPGLQPDVRLLLGLGELGAHDERVGEQLADFSIEIGIPLRQRDRHAQPARAMPVRGLLELRERGAKVDERQPALVGNMLDIGGARLPGDAVTTTKVFSSPASPKSIWSSDPA